MPIYLQCACILMMVREKREDLVLLCKANVFFTQKMPPTLLLLDAAPPKAYVCINEPEPEGFCQGQLLCERPSSEIYTAACCAATVSQVGQDSTDFITISYDYCIDGLIAEAVSYTWIVE